MAYLRGRLEKADILLCGDRIEKIGRDLSAPDAEVFPAEGLVVCPGFVDLHVHLREPGFSRKETIRTGTLAAAAGGFTTVCAMPNLSPVPDSLETLQAQLDIIEKDAQIEVLPYGAVTKGEKGQALADYAALAPCCAGFSDDGKGVQSEEMMRIAMEGIAAQGGLLSAHCEEESLISPGGCVHDGIAARRYQVQGIPSASEYQQIGRDLSLVENTGVRYHICHISAKESVALVRKAKEKGLPVTCECTPHQIMLCDEDIIEDDGRFKMNPPLRTREDREAILLGLKDGTIDCIATDHAPHTREEKSRGLQNSSFGVVGLETAFGVCYTALVKTGILTLEELLHKLTCAPARILGRDQALKEGALADVAILDLNAKWQVRPELFYSMGRSTPFQGRELQGRAAATFYRGRLIFQKGGLA